jgi:hypothetical protein
MANCPSGHDSGTSDYCDVCGERIVPGSAVPDGGPGEQTCPDCGTPRTGRFCEADGHDFLSAAAAPSDRPLPDADGSGEPAASTSWTVVITADRAYYDQVVEQAPDGAAVAIEFPAGVPERVLPLVGGELRIGRTSMSRGLVPEIDLSGPPEDPGVSHLHAVLALRGDDWTLIDTGSTNGTTVNGSGQALPVDLEVPVGDGDRIHVGAWTTIILRRTT